MATPALFVLAGVNAVTAAVFLGVAGRLARQPAAAPDRFALRALALWWAAMAGVLGVQSGVNAVVASGSAPVVAFELVRYANGPLLGLGSWGLCAFVAYLKTGSKKPALWLTPYFALVGVAYVVVAVQHPIVAIEVSPWDASAVSEPPLEDAPAWSLVVAGIGVPLLVACVSYLVLSRDLDPVARRRGMLAASGVLVWVAAGIVAQLFAEPYADFLTYNVFGLVAAAMVYLAYFPPKSWVRPSVAET